MIRPLRLSAMILLVVLLVAAAAGAQTSTAAAGAPAAATPPLLSAGPVPALPPASSLVNQPPAFMPPPPPPPSAAGSRAPANPGPVASPPPLPVKTPVTPPLLPPVPPAATAGPADLASPPPPLTSAPTAQVEPSALQPPAMPVFTPPPPPPSYTGGSTAASGFPPPPSYTGGSPTTPGFPPPAMTPVPAAPAVPIVRPPSRGAPAATAGQPYLAPSDTGTGYGQPPAVRRSLYAPTGPEPMVIIPTAPGIPPSVPTDGILPEAAANLRRFTRAVSAFRDLPLTPRNAALLRRILNIAPLACKLIGLVPYPLPHWFQAASTETVIRDRSFSAYEYRHFGQFQTRLDGWIKPVSTNLHLDLRFDGRGRRSLGIKGAVSIDGPLSGTLNLSGTDRVGRPWTIQITMDGLLLNDDGYPSGGSLQISGNDPLQHQYTRAVTFPLPVLAPPEKPRDRRSRRSRQGAE
ncbi:MAG: hypothetical protein GX442_22785 [Candidatus Riflebacteria bacterium]|nr:hypothetical protein [Candidatus Riflebacteria bacterium]